jgi:hypothetical protein
MLDEVFSFAQGSARRPNLVLSIPIQNTLRHFRCPPYSSSPRLRQPHARSASDA